MHHTQCHRTRKSSPSTSTERNHCWWNRQHCFIPAVWVWHAAAGSWFLHKCCFHENSFLISYGQQLNSSCQAASKKKKRNAQHRFSQTAPFYFYQLNTTSPAQMIGCGSSQKTCIQNSSEMSRKSKSFSSWAPAAANHAHALTRSVMHVFGFERSLSNPGNQGRYIPAWHYVSFGILAKSLQFLWLIPSSSCVKIGHVSLYFSKVGVSGWMTPHRVR